MLSLAVLLCLISSAAAEWKEQVLYSFQGGSDAATPQGGVVFDKQGNLYGTALGGTEWGTAFQLVPPAKKGDPWTESVIYEFQGKLSNDGQTPTGGLIIDAAGNLYGVTGYGGTGNCVLLGITVGCGTAYELSPPKQKGGKWTEIILHNFQSGKDGYYPWGTLTFDAAGNLYGSTYYGGGHGSCNSPYYQYCGTVFKLSPPKTKGGKWKEQVLYSFKGVPSGKQSGDGADPNGGLVLDSKGNIYGTTFYGGNEKGKCANGVGGSGCGIVFKLAPSKTIWTETILYRLRGQPDGQNPAAGLIFVSSALLGTTERGGTSNGPGGGMVFRLAPPAKGQESWQESALFDFSGDSNGTFPMAPLIFDRSSAALLGTTNGGTSQCHYGNVFKLDHTKGKKTWQISAIYDFSVIPDAEYPATPIVLDDLANIYGTTESGGTGTNCGFEGCGTVFKIARQ